MTERALDPWRHGALPSDWQWCGGDCASPTRPLTPIEVEVFTQWVARMVGQHDPTELLDAISWPIEMFQRSRPSQWNPDGRSCTCRRARDLEVPASGCYLYRLWGEKDRLLYVGVSTKLRNRLRSHRKRWGDLIERVTWEQHPDERSMLAAEAAAIQTEDPALNKAGV